MIATESEAVLRDPHKHGIFLHAGTLELNDEQHEVFEHVLAAINLKSETQNPTDC